MSALITKYSALAKGGGGNCAGRVASVAGRGDRVVAVVGLDTAVAFTASVCRSDSVALADSVASVVSAFRAVDDVAP